MVQSRWNQFGPGSTAPVPTPPQARSALARRLAALMGPARVAPGGPLGLRQSVVQAAQAPAGARLSTLARSNWGKNLVTGGLPFAAGLGAQTAINASPLSDTQKAFASLLPTAGVNAAILSKTVGPLARVPKVGSGATSPQGAGFGLKTAGAGLGLSAGGLAAQLVDPEDTSGVDLHDAGQAASTAGLIGPAAIALGASGPVGWGLAGIGALGAATQWGGLFEKSDGNWDPDELSDTLQQWGDLYNRPIDEATANEYAQKIQERLALQIALETGEKPDPDKMSEMIGDRVSDQLQQAFGALEQSPNNPVGVQTMLQDMFGLEPPKSAYEQMLAETNDLVREYQQGYAEEAQPTIDALEMLEQGISGINYGGSDPAYSALLKANQAVMAAQIDMQQQLMRQNAFNTPLDVARDYAFALSQGYQPSASDYQSGGGSQSIDELLLQAGG
jgi:hypothetical protein